MEAFESFKEYLDKVNSITVFSGSKYYTCKKEMEGYVLQDSAFYRQAFEKLESLLATLVILMAKDCQ